MKKSPLDHASPVLGDLNSASKKRADSKRSGKSKLTQPHQMPSRNIGPMPIDSPTSETFLFPLESTSFAAASHAKTFRLPAHVQGSTENAQLFGEKCSDLFAKLSPDGSWLKMYGDFSQAMTDGSLETFSGTWPLFGTMRNGECFQRAPWVRHTHGKGCSLWPTPSAQEGSGGGLPNVGSKRPNGKRRQIHLRDRFKDIFGKQLTIHFCEWLMGFPSNWLCGASETPSSRKLRKKSGR